MPRRRASRLILSAVLLSLLCLYWHATSILFSARLPRPEPAAPATLAKIAPLLLRRPFQPAETSDLPQQNGPFTFIVYLKEQTDLARLTTHLSRITDHRSATTAPGGRQGDRLYALLGLQRPGCHWRYGSDVSTCCLARGRRDPPQSRTSPATSGQGS